MGLEMVGMMTLCPDHSDFLESLACGHCQSSGVRIFTNLNVTVLRHRCCAYLYSHRTERTLPAFRH